GLHVPSIVIHQINILRSALRGPRFGPYLFGPGRAIGGHAEAGQLARDVPVSLHSSRARFLFDVNNRFALRAIAMTISQSHGDNLLVARLWLPLPVDDMLTIPIPLATQG